MTTFDITDIRKLNFAINTAKEALKSFAKFEKDKDILRTLKNYSEWKNTEVVRCYNILKEVESIGKGLKAELSNTFCKYLLKFDKLYNQISKR